MNDKPLPPHKRAFEPLDYDVELTRGQFVKMLTDDYVMTYADKLPVSELLLHPREAAKFCDEFRHKTQAGVGWTIMNVPDSVLLSLLLAEVQLELPA